MNDLQTQAPPLPTSRLDIPNIYTLFISDEAYVTLMRDARMSGYRTPDSTTGRGMGEYIAFLMDCNMQDARPDDVRAIDAELLADGMAPEWRMHGPRERRKVKLTERTLAKAAAHCLTLGLAYAPARRITGAPTFYDLTQCMSALLEAIGTEWIEVHVNG